MFNIILSWLFSCDKDIPHRKDGCNIVIPIRKLHIARKIGKFEETLYKLGFRNMEFSTEYYYKYLYIPITTDADVERWNTNKTYISKMYYTLIADGNKEVLMEENQMLQQKLECESRMRKLK